MGAAGNQLRWLLYLDPIFPSINGIDKIEFIKQQVYPVHRTWNNWLYHEWAWRTQLDSVIQLTHNSWGWQESLSKQLYLTMQDIELPYLHYFHLNLGSNHYHFDAKNNESGLQKWAQEFELVKAQAHQYPNIKIVYSDSLFESVLSKELYDEVVDFFNLENRYQDAAMVQKFYHQCRTNSMKEFHEYFTGSDFNGYVTMIKHKFLNGN